MIYYFYGDDDFEISRLVRQIQKDFVGRVVVLDSMANIDEIQSHIQSLSLFDENRLVVLKNVSENSGNWKFLANLIESMPDSLTLLVVETKPDKRSITHKKLASIASVKEFLLTKPSLDSQTIRWVNDLAKAKDVELDNAMINDIITKSNFNKWSIDSVLDKIALMKLANLEINLDDILISEEQENIFSLFEASINYDQNKLSKMVNIIAKTEDPYKTLGLLGSQFFNLVAISASHKTSSEIAQDLGVSPYVLSKLKPYAKKINKTNLRQVAEIYVEADTRIKSTSTNPWLVISQMLLKINGVVN